MTTVALPGIGAVYPDISTAFNMAPSFASGLLLDATGEKAHIVGRVWWSDRGAHDITGAGFRAGAITSAGGSALDISLQDVSLTAGPPGRGDGTKDQTANVLLSALAATAWNEVTFAAARADVAHNTLLALVFEYDAAGRLGADSVAIQGLLFNNMTRGAIGAFPVLEAPAGTFTHANEVPILTLTTDTVGVVGFFVGALPVSAVAGQAFNINTAGADEYSNQVVLDAPLTLDGVDIPLSIASGSSNFSVILYDGTTAVETLAVDANTLPGTTGETRWRYFPFNTRRPLTPGTVYRVAIRPDTTANVTIALIEVDAAAYLDLIGGQDMHIWSRVDGGAWGGEVTTRMILMRLHLSQADDGAGGAETFTGSVINRGIN